MALDAVLHASRSDWGAVRVRYPGERFIARSYYIRPFPKEALRAVVVGAKYHDLNEFVVSGMLDKYDYKDTKVVRGEVNIRGADGT